MNRPGRQAGIRMSGERAPKVRHSIKNITRVILDSMVAEQVEEFFLKIPPLVMLVLIAYIFDDSALLRTADAERGVSLLPREPLPVWESLPYPTGRIGLERIH